MTEPSTTPTSPREIDIRPAIVDDVSLIAKLVAELADYEKLTHLIDATPDMLRDALFGPAPRVHADIASWKGEPAGFALWFYNFSTFRGRHGIYLEDIFVRPAFRSHGLGKALLKALARRCVDEKLARLEWVVLDWNTPAIEFYQSQGADLLEDWTVCRLTDGALARLAAE